MDLSPNSSSPIKRSNAKKAAPAVFSPPEERSPGVSQESVLEWDVGRKEALTMVALMIVSLTAALDTTVLVPVLPVSKPPIPALKILCLTNPDNF